MSLTLEFLTGERVGQTVTLEDNASIGRQGDIPVPDAKLSKIHAFLKMEGALGWLIEDNNSKNGLRVNEKKTDSCLINTGDIIEMGETQLKVTSCSVFWRPLLNQLIIESIDNVKNEPMTVKAFHSIPVLKFIQGIQYGQSYILEYGPREVGGESEDIQLFEPLCPDIAFEIKHHANGVQFTTQYPKIVKINNRALQTKLLKKGDKISIHNTVIEVDFLNL